MSSKLESIVPGLELCKLIPAGAFADSALVWVIAGSKAAIYPRPQALDGDDIPAPTLAEILAALPNGVQVRMRTGGNGRRAYQVYHYSFAEWTTNPAAAALRLWMRCWEDQSDKSDDSDGKEK